MPNKLVKAVLPVGGLGTRFLPATKALPKEMLPVVDKPIVHYAYEEAVDAGMEDFIFVTGRNKNAINNHFDHVYELQKILTEKNKQNELELTKSWMPDAGHIFFTRQMAPLGLGHAIWCARKVVGDEPFSVLLPDDMILARESCLSQMVDIYNQIGRVNIVAVQEVAPEDTSKYGILEVENDDGKVAKIKGMVEKPAPKDAPSNLAIIGRYILQPQIFDYLDAHEKGAGGEIQLTDAIANMLNEVPCYAVRFDGTRYDCGNRVGFLEANIAFALSRPDMKDKVQEMLNKFIKEEKMD